jgi:hypothetical protein
MSAEIVPSLTCDDVLASLGAHALGVLDGDEADAIDEHLAHCRTCREEYAIELRTVEALALAVPQVQPSADARARLLAAAAASPVSSSPEPISIDTARPGKRTRVLTRWVLPLVSAAAVLLLIGVGTLGVLLNRTVDQRDDARSAAQILSTYVSSGGQVVTFEAQDASIYQKYKGQGSLLTAPGKEPVVVVAGCPKSGDYLTYWVWFSRDGKRTPAGKLTVGGDGSGWLTLNPNQPLSSFDTIGITVQLHDNSREDVMIAPLSESSATES